MRRSDCTLPAPFRQWDGPVTRCDWPVLISYYGCMAQVCALSVSLSQDYLLLCLDCWDPCVWDFYSTDGFESGRILCESRAQQLTASWDKRLYYIGAFTSIDHQNPRVDYVFVFLARHYGLHRMLRHTRLHSDSLVQNAFQETEEKLNWYGTATTMFTNIRVTPGNDPTGQYELSVLVSRLISVLLRNKRERGG